MALRALGARKNKSGKNNAALKAAAIPDPKICRAPANGQPVGIASVRKRNSKLQSPHVMNRHGRKRIHRAHSGNLSHRAAS